MYDQIQRLTSDMDALVEMLQSFQQQQRYLQESLLDHQRMVYSKLEDLRQSQAFTGELADAFFERHRQIAADARLALQNLGDHADVVHHQTQTLQQTREHFSTQMTHAMGNVPDEVWWFLGDRTRLPSMDEMLQGDAGEPLLSVWDRHVPAQMPRHEPNPLTGLMEWVGDEMHGAIASLFNTIASWGLHLEEVRGIVGWAGTIVQELQGALHHHHQSFTLAALSCPCAQAASHTPHHDPLPPPASTSPLPLPSAQKRARDLLLTIAAIQQDSRYPSLQHKELQSALQRDLSGLSPDALALVMQAYQQQMGSMELDAGKDFYDDIQIQIQDPQLRYELYAAILPQTIIQQAFFSNIAAGSDRHVIHYPPLSALAQNTIPQYFIWDPTQQQMVPAQPTQIFATMHNPSGGGTLTIAGTDLFKNGFPLPGTYTVVIEAQPGGPGTPPQYITFTQTVQSADTVSNALLTQLQQASATQPPLTAAAFPATFSSMSINSSLIQISGMPSLRKCGSG